ncbi:uncharacterized protein LOC120282272 [Dioscorea cayenensis subsp. rotundata]|uniref:Uncharacterized protein LOC120282272 n=1 Tax=Dioscorea cayennensis subsp. rotundata TaxID=55577 RepID=A0AB40D413_DIOCR|nr:uncharacterized protein LOC120282272 [Dioscorea cayenensis subsp. rotundata]
MFLDFRANMRTLISSFAIGLSIMFPLCFLLCCLLYWKKRMANRDFEREKEISCHIFRKKTSSLISSPPLNNQEMCIDSYGEQDSMEAELKRLHNLTGPPRYLFTIIEETKEDMESDDGKSKCGRRSRSEPSLLTPLSSPPFFNPLFSSITDTSSPPPKFQFLKDAEEKLYRKTLMEKRMKAQSPEGEEDGSFITVIIGKNRDMNHSSPPSHGKLISFLNSHP